MKNLFQNPNLSFDEINLLLEKVLEYKRWKVEKTLENNLRVAELSSGGRRAPRQYVESGALGDESEGEAEGSDDSEFNDLTSYGFCRDQHIGKIAKTKIWEASNMKATDLFMRWKDYIASKQEVSLKDLNDKRLRTLLLNFLWAHGCAHRIAKWPNAPDLDGVKGLKADLVARLNKYPRQVIVSGYSALKEFWLEINDYNSIPYNSSLIAEVLDQAEEEICTSKSIEEAKDIKTSPYFTEFAILFPAGPDLELLEKMYEKNRGDFVKAGVAALRRHHTTVVPEKFQDRFDEEKWKRQWHIFLPEAIEEWTTWLRTLKLSKLTDQKQWESTSLLPTEEEQKSTD